MRKKGQKKSTWEKNTIDIAETQTELLDNWFDKDVSKCDQSSLQVNTIAPAIAVHNRVLKAGLLGFGTHPVQIRIWIPKR